MYRSLGADSWWDWITGGSSGGGSSTPVPRGESRPGIVNCWDDDVRAKLQRDCSVGADTCTPQVVAGLLSKPFCPGTCGTAPPSWPYFISGAAFGGLIAYILCDKGAR